MGSDLEAAVARLTKDQNNVCQCGGTLLQEDDLRLLLADWERLREGHTAHKEHVESLEAERDAARAECEKLAARAGECHREMVNAQADLARLRERDARVRAVLGNPGIDRQTAINRALALLKETP